MTMMIIEPLFRSFWSGFGTPSCSVLQNRNRTLQGKKRSFSRNLGLRGAIYGTRAPHKTTVHLVCLAGYLALAHQTIFRDAGGSDVKEEERASGAGCGAGCGPSCGQTKKAYVRR